MALNTRIALGIVTIMALIAVWILPPRLCNVDADDSTTRMAMCGGEHYTSTTYRHINALYLARRQLGNMLTIRLLADSLRQELKTRAAVRSADGAISVLYQAPITADSARTWLRLAEAELARVPGTGRRPIVVALRSTTVSRIQPTSRVISSTASDATCFVQLYLNQPTQARSFLVSHDAKGELGAFLGVCALVARFGAPGAAVMPAVNWAYLERGPFMLGRASSIPSSMAEVDWVIPADQLDFQAAACVTHTPAACRAYVVTGQRSGTVSFYYGMETGRFFAWLLAKQDSSAFGRFWRSPGSFDAALSSAYGRSSDDMLQAWGRARWRSTASPSDGSLLAELGWLGLAGVAAVVIGSRRRVSA